MKNQYTKMAIGLYINYFLLGMVNIILASNMESLSKQLGTTAAGISYLVSAIGIGKLVSLAVAGRLSDKYGRKPFVVAASFIYLIFLIGIPLAPNYALAFIFAVSAGIANSFLDSGTYPALIEGFPKKQVLRLYWSKPLYPSALHCCRFSSHSLWRKICFTDTRFSCRL